MSGFLPKDHGDGVGGEKNLSHIRPNVLWVKLSFFKYQGLGNDFVLIDRRSSGVDGDELPPNPGAWAEKLCHRRLGVGADGVLFLLSTNAGGAAAMRIYNADGSEAEMCGNGLRCLAKHLMDFDDLKGKFIVDTGGGPRYCEVDGVAGRRITHVKVDMGRPEFLRSKIPMLGQGECVAESGLFDGVDPGLAFTAVSMGNPHLVCFLSSDKTGSVKRWAGEWGPVLEVDRHFPNRANVSFVKEAGEGVWEAAVWERGVGLTEACGTGACAIGTAACKEGRAELGKVQNISLPGGVLNITVEKGYVGVIMEGPAEIVFRGTAY